MSFYMNFDKQVFVGDRLLEEPHIYDLTNKDIENGYASKEHLLSSFTISEMIGGEVTVFFNETPSFDKNK